jgi:hypothetical protein
MTGQERGPHESERDGTPEVSGSSHNYREANLLKRPHRMALVAMPKATLLPLQ